MQFDAEVSDKIDTTIILQAHGGHNNFTLAVEWAYVDYNFDVGLAAAGSLWHQPDFRGERSVLRVPDHNTRWHGLPAGNLWGQRQ